MWGNLISEEVYCNNFKLFWNKCFELVLKSFDSCVSRRSAASSTRSTASSTHSADSSGRSAARSAYSTASSTRFADGSGHSAASSARSADVSFAKPNNYFEPLKEHFECKRGDLFIYLVR